MSAGMLGSTLAHEGVHLNQYYDDADRGARAYVYDEQVLGLGNYEYGPGTSLREVEAYDYEVCLIMCWGNPYRLTSAQINDIIYGASGDTRSRGQLYHYNRLDIALRNLVNNGAYLIPDSIFPVFNPP